jgi:hypothetical protein
MAMGKALLGRNEMDWEPAVLVQGVGSGIQMLPGVTGNVGAGW